MPGASKEGGEQRRAEQREERDAPLPPPARLPFPMRIYVHVRSPRVCRVFPLLSSHFPVNIIQKELSASIVFEILHISRFTSFDSDK